MDYSANVDANVAAQLAVQRYAANLDEDDPSYAGLAIVASGVRIYVVEPLSEQMRSLIGDLQTTAPVETQSVRWCLYELCKVIQQITDDREVWRQRGILLSSWGAALSLNLVRVSLQVYRPEFGQALIDEYGSDIVTVATKDELWTAFS